MIITETVAKLPLISVIIPIYNVAPYLQRSIESVLGQTHQELEILLVNDGSTDSSGDICDEYARNDKRVRVINQANAGVSTARNAGLDAACGEWIGFVDGDDWIEPEMYEKLLDAAILNSCDMATCGLVYISPSGIKDYRVLSELPVVMTRMQVLRYRAQGLRVIGCCCALYNRHLIKGNGGDDFTRFNTLYYNFEDILFTTQVILKAEYIAHIPEALYCAYKREGSASRSPMSGRKMTTFIALRQIVPLLEATGRGLSHAMRLEGATLSLNALSRIDEYDGKFINTLRREAWRYAPAYLLSTKKKLEPKLRYIVFMICPKLAKRIILYRKKRRDKSLSNL